MTSSNSDHFSKQSAAYAKYRPRYPDKLFSYLASLTPEHRCALDCATGNGQAALGLAQYFDRVIAIDISEKQIAEAPLHLRIQYNVGRVERLELPAQSADLVAVAQALHWFNLDEFYNSVRQVVRPKGAIAAWCYNRIEIEPGVDEIVHEYHDAIVGPYWPAERFHVLDGYRSLPFPFHEIQSPTFVLEDNWVLENLLGYLQSWSATQRYKDARGENPLLLVQDRLGSAWGTSGTKLVRWPLSIRIGFIR
jgi:SAM-dependent methyltransferase